MGGLPVALGFLFVLTSGAVPPSAAPFRAQTGELTGQWVFEKNELRQKGVDSYELLTDQLARQCARDDYYQYNEDGSFKFDRGDQLCKEGQRPVKGRGSWQWLNEGEAFVRAWAGTNKRDTLQIVQLTAERLQTTRKTPAGTMRTTYRRR
jgi:hypothetical protein